MSRVPTGRPPGRPCFDAGPLLALVPGSQRSIAAEVGVDRRTVLRWRQGRQIAPSTADRAATRLGLHPSAIWEDWS